MVKTSEFEIEEGIQKAPDKGTWFGREKTELLSML